MLMYVVGCSVTNGVAKTKSSTSVWVAIVSYVARFTADPAILRLLQIMKPFSTFLEK